MGAVFNDDPTGGQWNDYERSLHINVFELKAIDFGLKSFFAHVYNEHIRIKSDNITVIAYINNKGGVETIECHRTVKVIWEWAIERRIILSAEHIPGSQNFLAEKASRVFDINTEWELSLQIYTQITDKFGKFDIDLFASRLNAKNVNYAS